MLTLDQRLRMLEAPAFFQEPRMSDPRHGKIESRAALGGHAQALQEHARDSEPDSREYSRADTGKAEGVEDHALRTKTFLI